jgi:hypothetical protein
VLGPTVGGKFARGKGCKELWQARPVSATL